MMSDEAYAKRLALATRRFSNKDAWFEVDQNARIDGYRGKNRRVIVVMAWEFRREILHDIPACTGE